MKQPSTDKGIKPSNSSLIGTVNLQLFYFRYESEYPNKIVIIQDYYFLKDAEHFKCWLQLQNLGK